MTTVTTQNRGAWSVASVKMGNPSLVLCRWFFWIVGSAEVEATTHPRATASKWVDWD